MSGNTSIDRPKGWDLLKSSLRDMPIVDAIWTIGYFFAHPLKFTDEVLAENWKNKAKPLRFLIETQLLSLALLLITPWRLLFEQSPEQSTIQHGFIQVADTVGFCIGFFAACAVAHPILGSKRIPFIRAFYLFCYIQGAQVLFAHLAVSTVWLIHGEAPTRAGFIGGLIAELLFFAISIPYSLVPVRRAYGSPWYRIVLASLSALLVCLVVALAFSELAGAIAHRFPST